MLSKNRFLVIISMMLVILLMVEVPIGAVAPIFGIEDSTSELIKSEIADTGVAEENSEIISEVEDERTENSKTFRLSDGTNMIAQYNIPIHYKNKKGDWVDYDNTLTEIEKEVPVSLDEATADSVDKVSVVNNEPSKRTEKKQMLKNKKSDSDIAFSNQTSSENMVLVEKGEHTVSWGYKDIKLRNAKQKNNKKLRLGNDKFTVLDNLTGTVVYESAYDGVDIECITTPVGVKENIILNKKSATNKFVTTYDIGELRAEKLNDREIALYNDDNEIEYYINALYMYDAKNETSEAIVLNIIENENGKLVVELVADEQWVNAKERVYPVTIDPTFMYGQEWGDVQCTYIDSANPNTAYGYGSSTGYTGTVYTGTYGVGNYRSLMKINELPTLNKGDMIVGAAVHLPLYTYGLYDDAYVGVYEAEESWSQNTVTWNNQPNCSSLLVDYCNAYESLNNNEWCYWNITNLVKQWYNGNENNGFYFKMVSESTNLQCIGFYSSNYPLTEDYRPVFQLRYLNNKGVEDYWSYTSFSVGDVGTAHVNDYSGALTFELPIASTADPYMSAGVSYVYNSYMANIKYDKNTPYFGDGWRMNMQQTVLPSSNFGLEGDDAEKFPYVYTDADGTDHYFKKVTEDGKTKYMDEDGLDLELTIDSESNGSRYTITDKNKNKWYFHKTGLLNRTEDPYQNKQQVSYDGTSITSVSDKTGNSINFNLNSSNYVKSITDSDGKTTAFVYDSGKRVTKVTRHDGTSATFSYYSNGLINTITDSDGYKVVFTYDDNGTKSVASVVEYGTNGTIGSKMTFDRTNYNETVIRSVGVNGQFGDSDDCVTTCQFDDCGRMTGTYSKTAGGSDMGAESFSYTSGTANSSGSNIKTLNKVSKHHNLGANTVNYARNTSFETEASWAESSIFGGAEYATAYDTTQKLYGQKSLKVSTTSYTDDGGARRYQDITNLTEGKTYTLSGYLKVTSLSQLAPSNSGAFVAATTYTSSGTEHHFSEYITEVTDININNGWRRVDVTFEVPTGTTKVRLTAGIRGAKGSVYFDAIQVEYGKNVGSYNMIQNASFESNSNHIPTSWSDYQNMDFGDSKDGIAQRAQDGSVSFSIKGNVTQKKSLYQEIPISGAEKDTYILSGWAKTTTAVPIDDRNNRFRLSVHIVYAEKDSNGENYVEIKNPPNFNTSITSWQFSSYAFTLSDGTSAKRTPIAIRVFLTYSLQGNRAYFDNIQLVKEPAQSYTYDDEGNLISVVATAEQNTSYEYNANKKVESYTDPEGNEYKYTYNDKGSLATYTNASGTKSTFDYDGRGALKYTSVISGANNKIESYKTINGLSTSNPTYSVDTIDQNGNTSTSIYDSKNGALKKVTDSKSSVEYSYNEYNDTLLSVTQIGPTEASSENTDTPKSSSVEYTYDSSWKNLLSIKTPNNTLYSLGYDEFGNRTSTKVGNRTLATYTYGQNNGLLQRMDYGNDSYITYTYDKYGNIRTQKVNGTTVYEGLADKTGAITKAIDRRNRLQYNYVYDSTNRLISSSVTNTDDNSRVAMYEYDFDLNNNMTKFAVLTPHGSNVTQYTYGPDNLPATSTFSNGKVLTHSYNTVSQPDGVTINTTNPIDVQYKYKSWQNEEKTYKNITDLIKTEVEKGGDYGFRYEYDEHNNITQIYEGVVCQEEDTSGTLAESYKYDYLDQMIEAIDYSNNKKYVYTYDDAGNIISEVVYNNETGAQISSNNYTYGDETWGDLLTEYNGQAITYDEIGNPLSYRDGITFSWSNGRQLDSYTKGDTNVEYTYDNDGMRLSKTVDGVEYTYLYENGLLVQETRGSKVFDYSYDADGRIRMVVYRATADATPETYYYALNSRNDVIGIYTHAGKIFAKYDYDAWGNLLSITNQTGGNLAHFENIATLQPFRYRSYYYDKESGFYYLQSRYYDPVTHRFICSDSVACGSGDSIQDYNLFAYCNNNPVNQSDPDGHWPKWVKNAVKWVTKNIVKPIVKTAQKVLSKTNRTYSRGVSGSASPGVFNFSGQGGVSIDTKGNIALQCSGSGGISTGDSGAYLTNYKSYSNAPSVYKLEGMSYQLGGTIGVPVEGIPLAVGGDISIMPDSELNKTYFGATISAGIGTPGKDLHVNWGSTFTLFSINIFDEFDKAYDHVMRW